MIRNGLPGQEEEDIGQMLANPDGLQTQDIQPATLTDARRADVLDVSDRLTNRTAVRDRGRNTIGERISNFMGKADTFFDNPDNIRALTAFGQAFTGPNSNTEALSQFALGQADRMESRAERVVLSRLLRGESLEDIPEEELNKLGVEGLQRVEEFRAGRQGEEFTEEQIAQQDRVIELRESGLDIERAGLDLREGVLNLDKRRFNQRVETETERLRLEEISTNALARLREAQADALGREGEGGGARSESVLLRRSEFIDTMSNMLPNIQEQIRYAKDDVQDIEALFPEEIERPGVKELAEDTNNPLTFIGQSLFGRSADVELSELPTDIKKSYDEAVNRRDALMQQERRTREALKQMQEVQQQALGAQLEGGEGGDETTGTTTGAEAAEATSEAGRNLRFNSIEEAENADVQPGERLTINDPLAGEMEVVVLEDGSFDFAQDQEEE